MKGKFLLLDGDDLELDEAERTIIAPTRFRQSPVINNGLHRCANFSNTVIKEGGVWRAWYMAALDEATTQRYTAHVTSANGLNWSAPLIVQNTLGREFSDILDTGQPGPERYQGFRKSDDLPPRWYANRLTSAEGLNWQDRGNVTPAEYGETWQPYKFGNNYGLLHRWNRSHSWTDKEGHQHVNTIHDPTFTRLIGITTSPNPAVFPASRLLFAPDNQDSGETQFYAVSSIIQAGQYYVGFLHVLRDDLVASGAPAGSFGTGYSVLIWSRDGLIWQRSRTPYFSPNPAVGSWDHAITWIDSVVPIGNEVWLFYGGYRHGHKTYTDRQIGVVKTKKDRYVAADGLLRTHPFVNTAGSLYLNMDGAVRVRVRDANNKLLKASGLLVANSVNRPSGINLSVFKGQTIKLEFEGGLLYSYRLA